MDQDTFEQKQWVTVLLSACLCAVIVALAMPWPV
jgi:hypothetical protein